MISRPELALAAASILLLTGAAPAENTVSDYLGKGWEIKAAWEGGIVLQKADQAVVCYVTGDVATKDHGNYLKNVRTVACSTVR